DLDRGLTALLPLSYPHTRVPMVFLNFYSLNRQGGSQDRPRGVRRTGSRRMTTSAMRVAGILVLAYLIGACTRVGHIQRNEPVRVMTFAGSPQAVAQCVQLR